MHVISPGSGSKHDRTSSIAAMVYRADGSARLVRQDEALDGEDVVRGFRVPLAGLFA